MKEPKEIEYKFDTDEDINFTLPSPIIGQKISISNKGKGKITITQSPIQELSLPEK